jgi:hypothetical protein
MNRQRGSFLADHFAPTVNAIISVQRSDGSIPWFEGGVTDPWDQVESAMGLSAGGCLVEAKHAYEWLAKTQLDDGSWYASYQDGHPGDTTKASHFISYIAVGVWHHYLISGDVDFLKEMWPTVQAAIDFVVDMQAPSGEIYWARSSKGTISPNALLTGSSSVYMSITCAIAIASRLGEEKLHWEEASISLAEAIRDKPRVFDWPPRNRTFAMDWYYPVLCGVVTGNAARRRLLNRWKTFVIQGLGSRCISERPWVTAAETCELAIALAAIGEHQRAATVFSWLSQMRDSDGAYWYGIVSPDGRIWPSQKPTWTSAAVLLAADVLVPASSTSQLFGRGINGAKS